MNDVGYAWRLLAKSPGFSVVSLIVIVIGLTVAICNYSLVYAITKAPSFPGSDRFFAIQLDYKSQMGMPNPAQFNDYSFRQFQSEATTIEHLGAFSQHMVVLANDGAITREDLIDITPELLATTQVKPLLGRQMTEADANPSAPPVVVIGYQFWRSNFAASKDVIGKTIDIDGVAHTVIGVMPQNFFFPYTQDIWRPLAVSSAGSVSNLGQYFLIGKLKPGITWEGATRDVGAVFERFKLDMATDLQNVVAKVVPVNALKSTGVTDISFLTRSITVIIFLLASLNLSTLLFTRANERQQELAIRNAVGANRWQLRKQLLVESGLLALGGALLALTLSAFLLAAIQNMVLEVMDSVDMSADFSFRLYPAAVLYAGVITVFIWLASAAYTVYKINRANAAQAILGGAGTRGATSQSKAVTTRVIISIEVVFSCFLLILCGLFSAAVIDSYRIDFGTKADSLIIGDLSLPASSYATTGEREQALSQVASQITFNTSVEDVAFTDAAPGGWFAPPRLRFELEDRDLQRGDNYADVRVASISNNFFSLVGATLVEGRAFDNTDTRETTKVAIVDELLARALWPDSSPLGKRIQLNPQSDGEWLTIVGVNSHIVHAQAVSDNIMEPTIYRPLTQNTPQRVNVIAKAANNVSLAELVGVLSEAANRVDRLLVIDNIMSLEKYQPQGLMGINVISRMMAVTALFSLLLSVIGVYGIVSRSVISRSKEIGIRRAMGSTNFKIVNIFIRQGGHYLLAGAVIGGGAAVLLSNPLAQIFPNIFINLPWVVSMVLGILGGLIYLASILPARQVIGLEPGDALRHE